MNKYKLEILPHAYVIIPHKYFLKIIRKKWRECGGTTCDNNINYVFGDNRTLIEFTLITNANNNLYKIRISEVNK